MCITETWSVGLWPYYVARDMHAVLVGVYIPPSANTISVSSVLFTATSQLQTKHPSALINISHHHHHGQNIYIHKVCELSEQK